MWIHNSDTLSVNDCAVFGVWTTIISPFYFLFYFIFQFKGGVGKTDQTHWHRLERGKCNFNSNMGLTCTPCLRNIYHPEKGKNRAFI